jgi:Protein of unknown function (DUF3501)
MLPLTVDDLLPLEEYATRRKEFFDAHRRYVDRYRRVRIGPKLTLIFENRQTLWFRVQEVIRIARLADAQEVRQELNLYNRLLPTRNLLQAALLIEIADATQLGKELAPWRGIVGEHLKLQVGSAAVASHLVTCRPEDRAIGTAHWVQFHLAPDIRKPLANYSQRAFFRFDSETYQHQSPPLSDDFRQSLLDDLLLSDRDGEKLAG